jgi:diguanylate cyclase (GGDEF)-like protein/PAS domain S-box-containing protein
MSAMQQLQAWWRLRRRFGWLLLLGLIFLNVGVLVMASWMSAINRDNHLDTARLTAQNYAQLAEQDLSDMLRGVDRMLSNTANAYPHLALENPRHARELVEIQRSQSPDVSDLWIIDAQGRIVLAQQADNDSLWRAPSAESVWGALRAYPDQGLFISAPRQGASADDWVILTARAMKNAKGAFAGAVVAPVSLSRFSHTFRVISPHAQGVFTVLSRDSKIVARFPDRDARGHWLIGQQLPSPVVTSWVRSGVAEGQARVRSAIDDVDRYLGYRRIADYGLSVMIAVDMAPYWQAWYFNLAVVAVLCALFMGSTGVFGWRLYKAWQRREDHVQQVDDLNARLDRETSLNQTIIDCSPFAIYTRDREGIVTAWNAAAEKLFGWKATEALGHPLFTVPPDRLRETLALRERVLSGESVIDVEVQRQRRDGSLFDLSSTMAPLRDAEGRINGYLAIAADVSARKAAERRVEFLAYRDVLTGLPNRQLLVDRFNQAIVHADRQANKVALLYLDLDNFKTINESLGHAVGDALLREVSDRISACVSDADTISRQGGDEYLILLPDLPNAEAAVPVLLKIRETLLLPFTLGAHELTTSASVGVAIYSDDGRDFETLLKKADTAMYRAKDAGGNQYRYFNEQMNVEAVEYLRTKNGLRRALAQNELVLHYQPQIEQATGRVRGVEALLRWRHPDEGLLPPSRFIPIAEDSGLIVPIGEWVLREACRQAVAWRDAGLPPLLMAVNLSPVQFRHGDLPQVINKVLLDTGCDPRLLELELTESLLIHDSEASLASVRQLKQLGVKLSIDDFGTGYSSLSYLKRFDVDKLKIDQSFIRDLSRNSDDAAIVRAIIQLASSLSLRTVAEGVEDIAALSVLRELGCDDVQGYYFARPMEAQAMTEFLFGKLEEYALLT